MVLGDIVISEERLSRNHVHIQRVQEPYVLGQISDRMVLDLFHQWMIKRNVDAAVTVLYVKDHGISTRLFPAADQIDSVRAACGSTGHIYGADLSLFGEGPCLFH